MFQNYGLMEREGLDVPETSRLLRDLRAAGMELEGEPLSVSDCAELIARELSTKRSQI